MDDIHEHKLSEEELSLLFHKWMNINENTNTNIYYPIADMS